MTKKFGVLFLILTLSFSLLPGVTAQSACQVWTDKATYFPSDTLLVEGSGFSPFTAIALSVLKEGAIVAVDQKSSDSLGTFTATFLLSPSWGYGLFVVNAVSLTGSASTTFSVVPLGSLATDKGGYLRGEGVTITGSGFPEGLEKTISIALATAPQSPLMVLPQRPTGSSFAVEFAVPEQWAFDSYLVQATYGTPTATVTCTFEVVPAPAPPPNVQATPMRDQVNLIWSTSTSSYAAGYKIYRSTSSGGPYQLRGTTTVNAYLDSAPASSGSYFYVLTTYDFFGHESHYSQEVQATPWGSPFYSQFAPIGTQVAGVPFAVTIYAKDLFGHTVQDFESPALLSDTTGTLSPILGNFHSGVISSSFTITGAGSNVIISVTTSPTGSSNPFTVQPGPAVSLTLSPSTATITAGSSQPYTLLAYDSFGNSWDVTSSATFSITPSAGGSWSANTYISQKAGTWTVTGSYGGKTSTATLVVLPGAPALLTLSPSTATNVVGTPHTLTAFLRDACENPLSGYTISFQILSGHTSLSLPSAITNSSGLATTTYTATTVGTDTIRASAGTIQSNTVTKVWTASVPSFIEFTPLTATNPVGIPHTVNAQVRDGFGNPVPGVTVSFTVSGAHSLLGSSGTNSSGIASFTYTATTVGTDTIRASTGTIQSNTVTKVWIQASLDHLTLSPSTATITAGSSQPYTLLAYDSFGNSWDVTSSATFSITPSAGGSWSANTYISQKAGTWTVTGSYGGKTSTATLVVLPGAAHHFQWDPIPSPQQATVPFPVHIIALDALGNIAISFTGTASLFASNGAVEPTSTGNFLSGEWSGNVAVLNTGSDVTLTSQSGSISGTSNPFEVLPNSVSLTYNLSSGWNLISLPLSTDPDPKVVFSGLPTWRFYAWNPITRSYLDKNHATLGVGKGYWLWVPTALTYQISGIPNTSSSTEIPLYSGWNLIGTPYNQAIPWDSVQVKRGSLTVSLNQAVANGWVRSYAYYWESNSYKMLKSGGSFEPLKGYWFYARVDGCTMVFAKP